MLKHYTNVFPLSISPSGQMTDLIFAERDLVHSLKEYIQAEESKLDAVKRYILIGTFTPNVARALKFALACLLMMLLKLVDAL